MKTKQQIYIDELDMIHKAMGKQVPILQSDLIRKFVLNCLTRYENEFEQLHKPVVGGPASASVSEGEQLGNEGSAKSVCGGVRNCNGNGIDNGLGYCIYCEEKIPRA